MAIVKLNRKNYTTRMYGRGIYGKFTKVKLQNGSGIVDGLGKAATKYVLGGIGKSTGAYAGKQLGKLIKEKTGSELLGTIAKAGLSSLGGVAGERLGSTAGKFLGNTVFDDDERKKKKKKPEETTSLSRLLDQARSKITGSGMDGRGINLIR